MKFFTRELLAKVNDCDPKIRGDAERQWKENDLCYSRQFESVKKHLPRFFVKEFLRRSGLHDYEIANISFLQRGRRSSCEIHLTNEAERIVLELNSLSAVHLDLQDVFCCMPHMLTWSYSEFDICTEQRISLDILCDQHSEMYFEFKSIKLIVQQKEVDTL